MPKVSIILPCYNVEKHLAQSIDSVLSQTHSNFELLVVIDGSPDNSKEIAEEYAVKDARITVFDKPNGGLSDARNYGLKKAQGEFIYFMDSDDWIEPDLLKDNLKIIAQENLNFIVFGYFADFKNTEEELTQQKNNKPKIETLKPSDSIDNYHLGILGYAWNKIYRKSFLDQHHFRFKKGISLIEDILFNAPIYQVSDIIRFNPHSYYHYIQREEETLVKKFYPDIFELQKMKIEVLEDW
ncbi:MAG TPA: glycosyltransferase family 2 protein, partial [Chitinophagaceae bacterium]|nr:glycosyltransferase family 2 protein [Chitinophagaceae bacterium]